MYHVDTWSLTKKLALIKDHVHRLVFTIPIFDPMPSQYVVRMIADGWLHAEVVHTLSFKHLILPERMPPHTDLLDLDPLPRWGAGEGDERRRKWVEDWCAALISTRLFTFGLCCCSWVTVLLYLKIFFVPPTL